ncbi:ATF-6 protein [Aphelenchoides avenae]|nr:ATF-6 protein [Aphelenchus avenae]
MNFVQLRHGKNPYLIYNSRKDLFPTGNASIKNADGNMTVSRIPANSTRKMSKPGRTEPRLRRLSAAEKKEAARLKAVRDRAWRHLDMIGGTPESANSVLPRQPPYERPITGDGKAHMSVTDLLVPSNLQQQRVMQLISSIKQKDDMLYVVAMQDYFLLPAVERNSTVSPKISIILPALAVNATSSNQITMMRIECQVIGTGVFYLSESLASLFNNSFNLQN